MKRVNAKNATRRSTPARASVSKSKPARHAPDDWRAKTLARVRTLVKQAEPDIVEDVKWRKPSNAMRGVPVWSYAGLICTGETYTNVVKLTFAHGAALEDPSGLFNAGGAGRIRRAIDLRETDTIDGPAFKALMRAAVALNKSRAKR